MSHPLNHTLLVTLGMSRELSTLVVDRITELEVELEKTKADRNRSGVVERSKYLPKIASLIADISHLRNEVDCRIEHGAQSGGHLEYVRNCLDQIMDAHRSSE